MNTNTVVKRAQEHFEELSKMRVEAVIGCSKTEEGWVISLEAVHKKSIPDSMDIMALYEVRLDNGGTLLLGFDRKRLRRRCDVGEV